MRFLTTLAAVDAAELAATLRLALRCLPTHYGEEPPDVDALLKRVAELDHKPAKVKLQVRERERERERERSIYR